MPGTWRIDSSAASVFSGNITALWGSGPGDVWAGDTFGTVGIYDGTAWQLAANLGPLNGVSGIHGSSATNIWIATLSGTVFQVLGDELVPHDIQNGEIWDVWTGGPNETYTTSLVTVRRWNGTSWSTDNPSGTGSTGVWGLPGGPVWVVSDRGWIARRDAAASWTEVVMEGAGPRLGEIAGLDANNIWAVGTDLVWLKGTSFERVGAPSGQLTPILYGVWVGGPGNVWAVGTKGLIQHGDGQFFQTEPSPTTADLLTIWGSAPGDIWVGGADGLLMHYTQ
jgi:hypothetical protein